EEAVEEAVEEPRQEPVAEAEAALLPEIAPVPQPRPQRPPPRQVARPEPDKPQRAASRPKSADAMQARAVAAAPAPRAAAPARSAGSGASVSPAGWQARVMAHLERRKRYPAEARRARQEGTAQVRFTIDANGNVGSVTLTRSSGVPSLDSEVLAL